MDTKLSFSVHNIVHKKVNSTVGVRAFNRTWFIKFAKILKNGFEDNLAGMVSVTKVLLASCILAGLVGSMPAQAFSFDSMVENIGRDLKKLGENVLQEQTAPSSKKTSKPSMAQQPGLAISQPGYNHDRQMVAEAQGKLTQLGYNAGIADGRYGKKTGLAIRAFQRDRGLPAKGNVTPQLLTQLSRETHGLGSSSKIAQTPAKAVSSSQESSMIALPPGGGLVAPAQGGGQISSTEGTIRSQSSLITSNQTKVSQPSATKLNSLDPLAPAGINIGMPWQQAQAILIEAGYPKGIGGRVEYGRAKISMRIKESSDVVQAIFYERKVFELKVSPAETIVRMTKRIGTKPECKTRDPRFIDCSWIWPPNDTLVKSVDLKINPQSSVKIKGKRGPGFELSLRLKGVSGLANRLASGATEEAPIGDTLDPLEPEGVAIGMAPWQLWPTLKQEGYKKEGSCEFVQTQQGGGNITFRMRGCKKGKPIRMITYTAYDIKVANSILDVVTRIKKRIGAEPTGCKGLTENGATCYWESLPTAPLIQRVYLETSKTYLYLKLTAVPDLDARVTLPSPPPSSRKTPWWERELAAKTRSTLKFNNQNDQLTQDERGKIRGEAKTVYDYCKGRQLFSSFHDCGCVSQQFLDTRAQEVAGWKVRVDTQRKQKRQKAFLTGKVDQYSLIGMADKVADACPNKAGAAKYGYGRCITLYEYRLQDNLETFCTCYGDRFSKFYMRDPRAFMPNITSKMSAALTACSEEISPNPLNHD